MTGPRRVGDTVEAFVLGHVRHTAPGSSYGNGAALEAMHDLKALAKQARARKLPRGGVRIELTSSQARALHRLLESAVDSRSMADEWSNRAIEAVFDKLTEATDAR